ncbi:SLC13 family permease [Streptosporangium sp. NBC_01495]|uniref:SLC13 family permease n=1 Tax=Streptosporangium sp. NBC_01495 TaxID=2903899 RepID=UPI002E363211|nr:SLC13 family permease [Streptosporangium sp. NBC_01495]
MSDVLRRLSVLDRIRFGLLGLGLLFVATGLLPVREAWSEMERIAPILLFLGAVIILADLVKEARLFDVIAIRLAAVGRGNHVALFLLCTAFASVVTIFLNLDTTVVLLTPVMLALAARTGIAALPLAMTTLWLANTAALLLPVSNLTNLLAVERLGMSAREFAGRLWFPQLVSIAVTMVFLWVFFWRRGRRGAVRYDPPTPGPVADPVLFRIAASACVLFVAAILLELPIQFAALAGAALMIAAFAWRDRSKLTLALFPWQLLVFVVGLFLVVPTLSRYGLASVMSSLVGTSGGPGGDGAYRVAAVGAVLSNLINNLPAYTVVEQAIPPGDRDLLFALLVGTNAGSVITPWASLATLLWFEWCRRRGVRVPMLTFVLAGTALVMVGVTATVTALLLTA